MASLSNKHPLHACTYTQTEQIETGKLAAMKRVPIVDDSELDDFMVEIDILAEYKHRNIVGLHEAYFYDQALWVSELSCATACSTVLVMYYKHATCVCL